MAIYKRGGELELGTTEHKSSRWPERGSNPGTAGLRVRRADHSATLCKMSSVVSGHKLGTTWDVNQTSGTKRLTISAAREV